jgi:hypothetical protein
LKLLAEIEEEDLLFKLMHILGATFYRAVGEGIIEVVYFSGEKVVHFKGKLSAEHKSVLEASAWKVSSIEVSEIDGTVKIKQ